ncbi:MAG: ribosome biogenesis GTP-binding protein YihA/YsxC [Gammaproteobacteria bacterium]
MSFPPYHQATFLRSAASLNDLTPDIGAEVAFIGRSNAGKSSALNWLCGQKQLARVSNTPGRTQLINYFALDTITRHLVDLPGYGFAKASKDAQAKWQDLIDSYLHTRQCLKGLVLLMDIRHPLQSGDKYLLEWCEEIQMPVRILLSKTDKVSRSVAMKTLKDVEKQVNTELCAVQLFSTLDKIGLDELVLQLDYWLGIERVK